MGDPGDCFWPSLASPWEARTEQECGFPSGILLRGWGPLSFAGGREETGAGGVERPAGGAGGSGVLLFRGGRRPRRGTLVRAGVGRGCLGVCCEGAALKVCAVGCASVLRLHSDTKLVPCNHVRLCSRSSGGQKCRAGLRSCNRGDPSGGFAGRIRSAPLPRGFSCFQGAQGFSKQAAEPGPGGAAAWSQAGVPAASSAAEG